MKYDTDYFDCRNCHGNGCDVCGGTGKSSVTVHQGPESETVKKNSTIYQCPEIGASNVDSGKCESPDLRQSMPSVKRCDLCMNYYHGDGYPVVNENFVIQKGLRSCGCNLPGHNSIY